MSEYPKFVARFPGIVILLRSREEEELLAANDRRMVRTLCATVAIAAAVSAGLCVA